MTKLHQLHDRYGQSPWLDNPTRGDRVGGRLRRPVARGIQGVTSNPTIIAKAIRRLDAPNLLVKIPATVEGVAAFANSYDELLALLQARADSSWQVLEATRQPGARSGTGRDAPASLRTRS
jgi:hypothetical protein